MWIFRHLQAQCQHRYETYYDPNVNHEPIYPQEDFEVDKVEEEVPKDVHEEHTVGFTTYETFASGKFDLNETFSAVIIDTGCIKSVAGKQWFSEF